MQVELNPRNIDSDKAADTGLLSLLGQNVAGKEVSEWQVIVALVIFLLLMVVEGSLIYGSIHSTISALGRNPLARSAVYKQLVQVLVAVIAVLAFGLATIYAVLQV